MKKILIWLLASVVVMEVLPWLVIMFVRLDMVMPMGILLLFGVNPIYCAAVGIFAGKQVKPMWILPVGTAVIFLLGIWLCFDIRQTSFWLYAGIYLVIGLLAMSGSARWYHKKQK